MISLEELKPTHCDDSTVDFTHEELAVALEERFCNVLEVVVRHVFDVRADIAHRRFVKGTNSRRIGWSKAPNGQIFTHMLKVFPQLQI